MKVSEALLKRLAQLSETDRTVLSAYIDLRHGWDEANHFVIRESQRLMPLLTSEEQKHVQTSISFLLDYLAQTEAQSCRLHTRCRVGSGAGTSSGYR